MLDNTVSIENLKRFVRVVVHKLVYVLPLAFYAIDDFTFFHGLIGPRWIYLIGSFSVKPVVSAAKP